MPTPVFAIHLALLVAALAALDGAWGVISPRGAARSQGLELADGARLGPVRAQAAARLLGHAACLVALVQVPAIGACLGAGLGSAWLGGAVGRAFSGLGERRGGAAEVLRVLGGAVAGLLLWQPLWLYLAALRGAGVAHS